MFGKDLKSKGKADFIELLKKEPRRFITQEVIDTYESTIIEKVKAPKDGIVFYACEKSIVYTNLEIYKII